MSEQLRPILDDLSRYLRQQAASGASSIRIDDARLQIAATQQLVPAAQADSAAARLAQLDQESVASCTKCELHGGRTQTVFGVGNPEASLLIVGEAPGREEDLAGEPFVGAAGQLLTKILSAIGFEREDVYIANILKCRPPQNRDPEAAEVSACIPNLLAQLDIIQPKLILALGRVAAQNLLNTEASLGKLRTQRHDYHGIPLMVTYHPAALLRNEQWKKPTWEDVKALRDLHTELVG